MWIVQLGLRCPYTFGAAKVDLAVTQITSQAQSNIGAFPPGTQPPSITEYDSARVSILESGLESKVPAQKELFAIDLHAAGAGPDADGRGEIPVRASPDGGVGDAGFLLPLARAESYRGRSSREAGGEIERTRAHGWGADGCSFACGVHHWLNRPLALIRSSYVVSCDRAARPPGAGFDRFCNVREAAYCYLRRASTWVSPYRQSRADGAPMPRSARLPGSSSPKASVASANRILYYVCQ